MKTGTTLTELAESQNAGTRSLYLDITGMSCGMCSGRVQKALNKIDGVRATVSFPTKTATIETETDISAAALCDVVRDAGYGAQPRAAAPETASAASRPARGLAERFVGAIFGHARS